MMEISEILERIHIEITLLKIREDYADKIQITMGVELYQKIYNFMKNNMSLHHFDGVMKYDDIHMFGCPVDIVHDKPYLLSVTIGKRINLEGMVK